MGRPFAWSAAAVLLAAGMARGDEEPERRWYGYQTLATDLVSLGAIAGAAATGDGNAPKILAGIGIAGYLLGGPLVHLAHGQSGNAGKSVAWRLLAPAGLTLVGVGFGALLDSGRQKDCSEGCGKLFLGATGFTAGVAIAIIADAAFISHEPVPPLPRFSLAPILSRDTRGLAFALRF
jgi:hypothetical protein